MKLGVLTGLFYDRPLDTALKFLDKIGVQAVEIGTGAYPGNAHCDMDKLLKGSGSDQSLPQEH
jgi:sugar phosphate isomerase/epimerase